MKLRRYVPKLLALALSWLLIGYVSYTFAQTTLTTMYIMGGIYPGAPSYTIWVDGTSYFAKDLNGQIDYSGTNASYVFNEALLNGESVYATSGIYVLTSPILITHNTSALFGELPGENIGFFPDIPTPLPRLTTGTVFRIDTVDIDAIRIVGDLQGIILKDFSIDFNVATTGHGIYGQAQSGGMGLSHSTIENIFVSNHDKDHYALNLESALQFTVKSLRAYGGPLLRLYLTDTTTIYGNQLYMGNCILDDLYLWIAKTGITVPLVYMNRSNTCSSGGINLMTVDRMQLIGTLLNTTDCMYLRYVYYSSFVDLNVEVSNPVDTIYLQDCVELDFYNTYVQYYGSDSMYLKAVSSRIKAYGGLIDLTLWDDNATSIYSGVHLRSISALNHAPAINSRVGWPPNEKLTENRGNATVASGATVTHVLCGTPTLILVTAGESGPTDVYVSAPGATTFAISFGGGGSKLFYWYAEFRSPP